MFVIVIVSVVAYWAGALFVLLRFTSVLVPIILNYRSNDRIEFYNKWNPNNFFGLLMLILIIYSFFLLGMKSIKEFDLLQLFCQTIVFLFAVFFFESRMELPFRPDLAFRKFLLKPYKNLYDFSKNITKIENNTSSKILDQIFSTVKDLSSRSNFYGSKCQYSFKDNNALTDLNKRFSYREIEEKNNSNSFDYKNIVEETSYDVKEIKKIVIATFDFINKQEPVFKFNIFRPVEPIDEILVKYNIAQSSKPSLELFFNGKRPYRKITFTASAASGPGIRDIQNFFLEHTDLFDMYSKNLLKGKDVCDLINELVLATYNKKNHPIENPLNNQNLMGKAQIEEKIKI